MCAVVTMAATSDKDGDFDMVTARSIWVTNDAGKLVFGLSAGEGGDGVVMTLSAKSTELVRLGSTGPLTVSRYR